MRKNRMNILLNTKKIFILSILALAITAYPAPPKDSLDKRIDNLQRISGIKILKRVKVYGGEKLDNIKSQFGNSVQQHREIILRNAQINIITFSNNESASSFLAKVSSSAAGSCLFCIDNQFIEVMGDPQTQIHVYSAFNPNVLTISLLNLNKKNININNLYYITSQEMQDFENKFKTPIQMMLNAKCSIDSKNWEVNYILMPNITNIKNLKSRIIAAGQYPENIFSFENIIMEVSGKRLSKDERSKLYCELKPNHLTEYLIQLGQKDIENTEVYYLSSRQKDVFATRFNTAVEMMLRTRCSVDNKVLEIDYVLVSDAETANELKRNLAKGRDNPNNIFVCGNIVVDIRNNSVSEKIVRYFKSKKTGSPDTISCPQK